MADRTDPRQKPARTPATRVRRRVATATERLGRLPLTGVFLATLALGLVALLWPGAVGGILVLAVAAVVALILTATWNRYPPGARGLRLLVLGMLVVVAISKFR